MVRAVFVKVLILVAFCAPVGSAWAAEAPEKLVMDVSARVLEAVNRGRPTYEADPSLLQNELEALLDPVIDFDAFSKGVMGSFYAQATQSQRSQFRAAFKATLVDLYTSALVASEIENITVQETTSPSPTSASVVVNVQTTDGNAYVVQYSMRKDEMVGWKARNIILDGVNIGLTYRNQFKSAMDTEGQDLARVIQIWPELIDGE